MHCLLASAALLVTSVAVAAPSPTELRGAGPWKVDFADAACLLSRPYAAPDGSDYQVELTFEPTQIDVWLRIQSSEKTSKRNDGDTAVDMDGNRIAEDVHYNIFANPAGGTTREFWLKDINKIAPMKQSLRLITRKHGDFVLAADNFAAAARTVTSCMDDLHRSLGIEPDLLKAIVTPPSGDSPLQFVDFEMLPTGVNITLLYWVTEAGRVEECRLLKPSGIENLDQNVCSRFEIKGRLTPAQDKDGKSIRAPVYEDIRLRRDVYMIRT